MIARPLVTIFQKSFHQFLVWIDDTLGDGMMPLEVIIVPTVQLMLTILKVLVLTNLVVFD
jgi:hypothetical protein